jgi:surfactin synthase thioesterase subunit
VSSWLMQVGRRAGGPAGTGPRGRLILLAHAGGWPSAFRSWFPLVPDDVELLVGQLPGRGPRVAEPPLRRTGPIVEALADAAAQRAPLPTVVLGHSFGSVLAYELTRALERRGTPPELVVVSARQPPCFPSRPPFSHRFSDEELLRHVHRIGGIPAEMTTRLDLVRPALAAIRADLEALETYRRPARGTAVPILALCAPGDPIVVAERMHLWAVETTGGFRRLTFEGGHFFLYDAAVAAELVPTLTAFPPGRGPAVTATSQVMASSA